jgi:hypothetical protein
VREEQLTLSKEGLTMREAAIVALEQAIGEARMTLDASRGLGPT